jgi:hypothetical protein
MHCLLVCDSWRRPSALRRLWVLWELWCAVDEGRAIRIAMPESERAEARRTAKDDPQVWSSALAQFSSAIDVGTAVTTKPTHAAKLRQRFGQAGSDEAVSRRIANAVLTGLEEMVQ